jgi:hypothetical protein
MTNAEPYKLVPYETTITDTNLFELKAMHPTRVFVWRLHQQAEAALGADWEWYVGDATGWYPMRVQAKRLEGGSYPQLRTAHGVAQATTLIKAAAANGMEPLYVFYNGQWPSSTPWAPSCSSPIDPITRGCTLAPAALVQAAPSDKLVDLAPCSVPWSDLVCCGPPHLSTAAAIRSVLVRRGGGVAPIIQTVPLHARLAVLEGLADDDPRIQGLGGIVVVDNGLEPTFAF